MRELPFVVVGGVVVVVDFTVVVVGVVEGVEGVLAVG